MLAAALTTITLCSQLNAMHIQSCRNMKAIDNTRYTGYRLLPMANFSDEELSDLLRAVCKDGDYEFVSTILSKAGPRAFEVAAGQDENGWTALHWAANSGHLKIVKRLLSLRNPYERYKILCDKELTAQRINVGTTALHMAAGQGHVKIVALLLALSNARVLATMKNDLGWTALHMASCVNHPNNTKIVELLIALPNALDVIDMEDGFGKTALFFAEKNNCIEIVKLLKAYKKD